MAISKTANKRVPTPRSKNIEPDQVHALIEIKYNSKLIFPYDIGLEFMRLLQNAEVFDGYNMTEPSAKIVPFESDSAPSCTLMAHQTYADIKMRELLTSDS